MPILRKRSHAFVSVSLKGSLADMQSLARIAARVMKADEKFDPIL